MLLSAPRGALRCGGDRGSLRRPMEACVQWKVEDFESRWKLLGLRLKTNSLSVMDSLLLKDLGKLF